eukprot:1190613-Prorocentrum_minimum.AAC.1
MRQRGKERTKRDVTATVIESYGLGFTHIGTSSLAACSSLHWGSPALGTRLRSLQGSSSASSLGASSPLHSAPPAVQPTALWDPYLIEPTGRSQQQQQHHIPISAGS